MPSAAKGYQPDFLGPSLKIPSFSATQCSRLKTGSGRQIRYTHYSSFQHKERRLPLLCASNIRGEGYNAPVRAGAEPWELSDQIADADQLDNNFYKNDGNTFDRGHIVRRIDPCWGDDETADRAELETFRWTNCTPQHKKLNQKGGVWYQLEQHVMEKGVKNKIADISVFAGPVLSNDDKYMLMKKGKYKGQYIQVPTEYWKVIVWKKADKKLYAVGFLMSQWEFIKHKVADMPALAAAPLPDDYFEKLKFKDHKTYQVPVSTIEKKTGIKFNWAHVSFPYTASTASVVKAVPLKTKYTFGSLINKYKRYKATTGVVPSITRVTNRLRQEEKPLSAAQLKKSLKAGYGGAIKQYALSNIKL